MLASGCKFGTISIDVQSMISDRTSSCIKRYDMLFTLCNRAIQTAIYICRDMRTGLLSMTNGSRLNCGNVCENQRALCVA